MPAPNQHAIQPGAWTRFAPPVLVLSALLSLTSILAVGCGSGEPEATTGQTEPVAAPAAEAPDTTAAEPAPGMADDTASTTPEPTPASTDEQVATETPPPAKDDGLTDRERELASRESRLARREAALEDKIARLEKVLPEAEPSAPEPRQPSEPATKPAPAAGTGELDGAEGEPSQTDNEAWRLSQQRSDRAAREGLEPEPEESGDESLEPSLAPPPEIEPEIWDSRLLPSGTRLTVELAEEVASNTAQAGDLFRSIVAEDVLRGGDVVIPAGSTVVGRIVEAVPLSQRVGGRARLDLEFHLLDIPGAPDPDGVPIQADFAVKGKNETARDAATIGGAAVGGAILGRVLDKSDKGKGTVLGALIGAAAGTVIASRSEGEEVVLPEGARIELVLTRPVEVPVRR